MNYKTMSAAEFTERHDVTLERFYLWDQVGRPTLLGIPVICETIEGYAIVFEADKE